ncbi:FAD-dependent oxidoreductase [Pseudoroseomonas globiformis]|uniref:FAD-dependent oxidoreductase n=1 Tax=Teichococcus globiformis TaxID=2307229 RepID=A0ABV7G5F9_9PROT
MPDRADLIADVLVCGGGMAGSVAAVAAARAGASTLLVERWGFLGGSATAAAVGQFVGWETAAGRQVIRGTAEEIVQRLGQEGASGGHTRFTMSTGHPMDQVSYDPEALKLVLDRMVIEAGARVLFHATLLGVERAGRRIEAVTVLTKAGPVTVRPRVVIDASGDLDLLARAGAEFLPLDPAEAMQPATMMFRFGPIDYTVFDAMSTEQRQALSRQGVASGALARAALHQSRIPGSSDGWFNISRVSLDATDPFALSAGEMEGRRQAFAAARFLRDHVPGCDTGRLVALAAQLGIRESRRVQGDYVLTAEDLRADRRFPDAVAVGAYPMDIHPAQGAGLHFETFGGDRSYEIPYGCMLPAGLDNALVAGRGISATHAAHASVRVMPTTMAIGQAAGVAGAMAASGQAGPREVIPEILRRKLREGGAYLPD